ncbi:MAG: SDR family oxidoreductase [Candidatus Binataceae bacterium]|jgi:NAD(P)-dependent dehydrogenase (short-subunit alcohol dehydrogenase family)
MRTFLVTGADRGIGEALCLELEARGEQVIATCLGDSPTLRSRGIRIEPDVDVTSDAAIASLAERLREERLDILVHNAGVVHGGKLGGLDFAKLRHEYEVNALGPLRVTQALLGLLSPGSKVAIITSRVGSLAENFAGGLYGYRMSKAAANMLGICLARDLAKRGIAVVCLHPGSVHTEMTRGMAGGVIGDLVEPADAARGLLARIEELTIETTGTFRHANGEMLPW